MYASLVLVLGAFCGPAIVWCVTTETTLDVPKSGFSIEMIITKLQVLEYHILKTDLKMDERITGLASKLDNLANTVTNQSKLVQPIGQAVDNLDFGVMQIAQNLSSIQSEIKELLAEQRNLLTSRQFERYITEHGCNTTKHPDPDGIRQSNYTSCRSIPFNQTGIYQIQPEKPFKEPMTVLCDQDYGTGGWTVIQHRFDGSVIFYRGWQEYKNGFGSLEGEFWLGLDRIHQLTASKPHELVVLLEDYDGNKTYAKYDRFEIGDESQKYALKTLGVYSGTAGDSLQPQKGMKFTTLDADNDTWERNCAVEYTGAWWYTNCHKSGLNGRYLRGDTKESASGMVWQTFRGYDHSLKTSKMMIRAKT